MNIFKKFVWSLVVWFSLANPGGLALAQEAVDATGKETGAPECTGAGCGQGTSQGTNQGENQGGTSKKELGTDEEGNLLPGVEDTRQGAAQGSNNGVTAVNSETGADSENDNNVDANQTTDTKIDNHATTDNNAVVTGATGENTRNNNTSSGQITTGDAGISGTQVVSDNTAVIGGSAGVTNQVYAGDQAGDINLGAGASAANLGSDGNLDSVKVINEKTGAGSSNTADISSTTEEINEVQNDGVINNLLDLAAISGLNEANKNTGEVAIKTGDADVAATLVNLLNTTVINGDIWITVADVFGDLMGNVNIPDLQSLIASARNSSSLEVEAGNQETGDSSKNKIDIDIEDREKFVVENDADINTEINAEAITGQNDALDNTGGANISTGDATVEAGQVTVANTTVEGGNWGLFVINALNGWLGFLVGDNGSVQALSQEETIREIEAQNQQTGASSENELDVDIKDNRLTEVKNDAEINNEINASAITGQNETNKNTGSTEIETGDAKVAATAVNIANTTVKDGSLVIAVVNVLGDFLGDLIFGGSSLAQQAGSGGTEVTIDANNSETGANSENEIDVKAESKHETEIDNDAKIATLLNANVDTGNNRANRNTGGVLVETGAGKLALHSRNIANVTGIAGATGLALDILGLNSETGFDSKNKIKAKVNNERVVTVNNDANVSTTIGSAKTPTLINTGENTANKNTGGATILTGNADFSGVVENLINRVIVALVDSGIEVDAELRNEITGALSDNDNDVQAARDTLVTILNDALVDTILNILLNTGNNTANENTGGSFGAAAVGGGNAIATGSVCVHGNLNQNVNGTTYNFVGSIKGVNNAQVNNQINIGANTGGNNLNRNTGGGSVSQLDGCEPEKLAENPDDGGQDEDELEEDDQGGAGGPGAIDDTTSESAGKIAGVIDEKLTEDVVGRVNGGRQVLKRFPVAGSDQMSEWVPGGTRIPMMAWVLALSAMVLMAWQLDRIAITKGGYGKEAI